MSGADLSGTVEPKCDQLTADDLLPGPRTITITGVELTSNPEQPVAVSFDGDRGKPYRPGKSMRRVLIALWGTDGKAYIGRGLTLYRDETVKFGGLEVGGIRISHASHIDGKRTMALTDKKASKKPFTVLPLAASKPGPDESTITASVADLISRISAAADRAALDAITAEPSVGKQRTWLAKNRPALAANVDTAIATREAAFGPSTGSDLTGGV